MAFQIFYWKGSTAANVDSFNWNSLGNWRVLSTTTLPFTLISANRLPKGGDTVWFGRAYDQIIGPVGSPSIQPGLSAAAILSPCLFGGVGNTGGSWVGATGTAVETNGSINVRARPSYPFGKLGGKLDLNILNQWTTNLRTQGIIGATGADWILAYGTENSNQAPVWTCTNWFGATGAGSTFAAVTLHYENLGGTFINARGQWLQETKAECYTDIFGVTGASAGCTGQNFDGSGNGIQINNSSEVHEFGYAQYGNSNTIQDWTGYNYATPTTPNDTYLSGSIIVRGRFNYMRTLVATRNCNIQLIGAKINDITLYPTSAWVLNSQTHAVYPVNVSTKTYFDQGYFYMDEASSARKVKIGNIDTLSNVAIIHGDITASSGFSCALDAFAGSSGGVSLPLGSFQFTPPVVAPDAALMCASFGFPLSQGTKAATVITNVFANDGGGTGVLHYTVEGNFTVTNFYLYKGKLSYSSVLPINSSINITNLSMYNDSVFDATLVSPQFEGLNNLTINPQDNGIIVKPGTGNKLTFANLNKALD